MAYYYRVKNFGVVGKVENLLFRTDIPIDDEIVDSLFDDKIDDETFKNKVGVMDALYKDWDISDDLRKIKVVLTTKIRVVLSGDVSGRYTDKQKNELGDLCKEISAIETDEDTPRKKFKFYVVLKP